MAKKQKKKPKFNRSQSNFNIPSVRKMNKLSNQLNQKYNINHNNYSNDKNKLTNFLSEKKTKFPIK